MALRLTAPPDGGVMLAGCRRADIVVDGAAVSIAAGGLVWTALLAAWLLNGLGYSAVLMPSGRLLRRSAHPEDRPAIFSPSLPSAIPVGSRLSAIGLVDYRVRPRGCAYGARPSPQPVSDLRWELGPREIGEPSHIVTTTFRSTTRTSAASGPTSTTTSSTTITGDGRTPDGASAYVGAVPGETLPRAPISVEDGHGECGVCLGPAASCRKRRHVSGAA